jgi:hypothetical protein
MPTPIWVRERKYKIYRLQNGSANVVHFSPGPSPRRKTVVKVPRTKASNISAFLRNYYKKPAIPNLSLLSPFLYMGAMPSPPKRSPGIKNRQEIKVPFPLNCTAIHHLYQNSTNNGRTGHALTKANNTKRLGTMYNSSKGLKRIRQGVARLGSGKQAVVFLACTSPKCDQKIIIKVSPFDREFPQDRQPSEYEFKIHRQVFKVAPKHVSAMYSLKLCRDFAPLNQFKNRNSRVFDYSHQTITFGEYCHGGDFDDWLDKVHSRLTDRDMANFIFQILSTIRTIRKKYPDFRHNDLHLKNIMVDDTGDYPRLVLVDFGVANLSLTDINPLLAQGAYARSGISVNTSTKYDSHFFLNSLRIHVKSWTHIPQTRVFLDHAVPPGFRGNEDTHIHSSRLITGTDTSRLPSLDNLLGNVFLYTPNKSPSLSRSVNSPRNIVRQYSASSPNVPNAAELARNMLANNTGVSVSVMSQRPSAANFLKLSPRSRAALKTGGPVKPKLLKFNTTPRLTTHPIWSLASIRRNLGNSNVKPVEAVKPAAVVKPAAPRVNANKLLRQFMKMAPNATKVTSANLKTRLVNKGYSANSAQRAVGPWLKAWTNSRSNVNLASRALKSGRNLAKNGFTPNAIRIATRRVTLNMEKSPGGRIRGKKTLLMSRKKDELVQMARNAGIPHSNKTKQQLVNALYG